MTTTFLRERAPVTGTPRARLVSLVLRTGVCVALIALLAVIVLHDDAAQESAANAPDVAQAGSAGGGLSAREHRRQVFDQRRERFNAERRASAN